LPPDDPRPNEQPAPAVEVSSAGAGAVVALRGEHDLNSRPAVAAALARASGHGDVLVDLCDCAFIDSTIIGVVVAAFQAQADAGRRLELVVPPAAQALRRVTEVAGLATFMTIHETRAAGLASLG
jgi:anti-anti-sigma factor